MSISTVLKKFMKEKGFTKIVELHDLLTKEGLDISYSAVLAWHDCRRNPWTHSNGKKICKIIGCTLDELYSEDNSEDLEEARVA